MINCRRQVDAGIYSGDENKKKLGPVGIGGVQMLQGRDVETG